MAGSQMPPDVEARIRAIPGNGVCCDCNNLKPQWASISYGALVCLECSGQHRSLGVHLSFVRSVQMDSWTEKQIKAMETSGGNANLVEFFKSKGIEKTMNISQKYNTKQATYYRERLSRRLQGKTEPPPDPGRYDPATGGSEAQGAEALAGESVEQYNERQGRLREEARERLRQKFGNQGMGGVGAAGAASYGSNGNDQGDGLFGGALGGVGGVVGGAAGVVGGVMGGTWGFLKEKVIDNERVRDSVGGLAEIGVNAVGSLREKVVTGDLVNALKRNATFEEGSVSSKGWGWTADTASSVWEKSPAFADIFGDEGGEVQTAQAPRSDVGAALRTELKPHAKCTRCRAVGTRYTCSAGSNFDLCTKCFERPVAREQTNGGTKKQGSSSFDFDDDDWENDKPRAPDPTQDDMARMAKEMGMTLSANEPAMGAAKSAPLRATSAGYPQTPAAAVAPRASLPGTSGSSSKAAASPAIAADASPKAAAAKKKATLDNADDFFADFGM